MDNNGTYRWSPNMNPENKPDLKKIGRIALIAVVAVVATTAVESA